MIFVENEETFFFFKVRFGYVHPGLYDLSLAFSLEGKFCFFSGINICSLPPIIHH